MMEAMAAAIFGRHGIFRGRGAAADTKNPNFEEKRGNLSLSRTKEAEIFMA